ncbi:unnamed protein product [Ceratitis capitata]|uniref:(Mediterranean fruit fly) hypothetical protein n=1 Tax=Ceratitis capitata TaxID=7213 RepID=A0A811VFK2_CERCA|nr:unnamed protein product [Ceratitis capitata]
MSQTFLDFPSPFFIVSQSQCKDLLDLLAACCVLCASMKSTVTKNFRLLLIACTQGDICHCHAEGGKDASLDSRDVHMQNISRWEGALGLIIEGKAKVKLITKKSELKLKD